MKSHTTLILFPLLLISLQLFSQESAEIKTEVHSNQQVFITGEDIWLEGNILEGNTSSKSISVRLVDRNGDVKLEKDLQLKQNKFSGFVPALEKLISDYYFLDCVIKGEKTENQIQPVIVINPKIPPVLNCQPTAVNSENTAYNARISVQTDKNEYLQREPVQVIIGGLNSLTNISVSAERSDRLSDLIQQNTLGFNKTRFHQAHGIKELEGHVIKAKLTVNGNPQNGFTLLASIKSQRANIGSAKTDNSGIATFTLPASFENTQLVITTEKKLPNKSKIEILKALNTKEEPISFPCLQLNEFMREDIEQRILNSSINFRFYGNSSKAYAIPERDTTDFYGKPDQRFLLDEYVRFPNMEEVITEIIPELRIKKENGNPILQVLNIPFKNFFSEQALILVDGIPISNAREILDTDPLRIRSIDLITRRYMMGVTEFPGIVHFKSYKRDLAGLSPESNSLTSAFNGLQESVSLQAPLLTDSKMPDLRNLLLYEQNIVADETGKALLKFNTSDAKGTYTIKVRAMTASKQIVHKQLSFKVK